jgi:large subunit ribosomal protein L25
MSATGTTLEVSLREPDGSRGARRLRRGGWVPGIVYGGEAEPLAVQVDALTLNRTLARGGAVVDLSVDGKSSPVLLKDTQRHPVTGAPVHVDFLRIRMDRPIAAMVVLELEGGEESPGAREGGVLEQVTRELEIEALPRAIPDSLALDVSGMVMNDTLTLSALTVPAGVTLLDDPETVLVTLSPPRLTIEPEEELETETELVGEEGEEAGEEPASEPEQDAGGQ